jgi:hypothetical protein
MTWKRRRRVSIIEQPLPARLRPPLSSIAAVLAVVLTANAGRAATPDILPPDPVAIELPAGVASIGADDAPMRDLIAKARAGEDKVTVTLPQDRIGVGVWRVIWSAWDPESPEHPAARRDSILYVLPHGMTVVGASGGGNAIAGNNTPHIVRDAGGSLHMVWYDSWRGMGEGARYRRAHIQPDGSVRFETEVMPLGLHPGTWSSMPTLAAVGETVHFAWQTDGTLRYRSVTRDGDTWRWSDELDTKVVSPGRDTGPSIAADGNEVYILTPGSLFTSSVDGGRTWTTEKVNFGDDQHVKTASLTIDGSGHPVAASSSVVISPDMDEAKGHGGYWTIRMLRRAAPGRWERMAGPLDGRAEWAAPSTPDQDVLADWVRVMGDRSGGLHVTWHGTAVSRIYANDRAYYAWRPADGAWQPPIPLRDADPGRGFGWSYAPAVTLDGDRAFVLVFHDMVAGRQQRGFDVDMEVFRDGRSLAPALPVTRFARDSIVTGQPQNALSAWFPGAAPTLEHGEDGRIWADVLLCLSPTGVAGPALIVLDRLELTGWLKAAGP